MAQYAADSTTNDDSDILDDGLLSNAIDESSPFNLDDVPSAVESNNPVPQEEVFHSMFIACEGQETTGHTLEQTPVCTLPLSAFEKVFHKKDKATAANLLLRHTNLRVDPHLTFAPDHPSLLCDASKHFLDFVLVVSGAIGLHEFLLNTLSDHTFSVSLDFCLNNKQFKPKFGKHGFDPTGSMMAIGTGISCELWLGFCPLTHIKDISLADEAPLLNEKKHGETHLSSLHYHMAVMFIALTLAQISSLPIHIMHTYGTDEDFMQWRVKEVTNLYDQLIINLHLEDLKALHRYIVSDWDEWRAGMGKTKQLRAWIRLLKALKRANWQAEREYSDIRYMSMAIATDLTHNVKSCGVLVNLEIITELFSAMITNDDMALNPDIIMDDDNLHIPRVNVYPQAFLRKYGHIQCNAVLPHFAPFMSKICKAISQDTIGRDEFDDHTLDDDLDYLNNFQKLMSTVLLASGCQFYNEISHCIRLSAALHNVQKGHITSALLGAYATTRNTQTTHMMVLRECSLLLPHQCYNNKIDVNDVPYMVVPLASYWSHPTIFEAIRPHLFVLTAEAFPHVYQWTTYPITSLLECIWEHFLPVLTKGGKPAPQVIELCSILECTLAYAHTGNSKVTTACNAMEAEDAIDGELHASQQHRGLCKWLATAHPLGHVDKAYEHLVSCMLSKSTAHHKGSPNPTKDKLSIQDFACLICEMSRGTDPVTIATPLIFNGGSTPVFRITLTYMRKYAPQDSTQSSERFLQEAFIIAANHLHINNIPWHGAAGLCGRRRQKPVFDSWLSNAAANASQCAQVTDTRTAWSAELITLQSLADYILRSRLPDEFAIESIELPRGPTAGSKPSVSMIYEWVFANFDINKPLHQIALIAGIYVSQILPDLFFADSNKSQGNVTNPVMLTKAIRALPWKPHRRSRKGCRLPSQFIAMVPAYIIAVYAPTSSLCIHLKSGNSFPTIWNSKNIAKGIGPLLLVRLGLASALSHRIWKGGLPLVHWTLLSPEDITVKHREISACLADRHYGPFHIAVMLFGIDKAVNLGRTSQTYTINPAIASIRAKKHMLKVDSDDDKVEIVQVKTVKFAHLHWCCNNHVCYTVNSNNCLRL
ncbi:hypothetical protein DFJ58DRAFT_729576 [Suillus subalutaceus]|uniref:uncharacterized protein n=1 Tax=Suillus subalutaceus TaxID=48586 RepID=UPI001B8744A6|nr:uncharacterized protein DFJ58DRAFT_729576 [Suillus subalutaceus]KAG1849284.1 hypothetical protein DFJ58DRAFT_729576 [Suillus subalutaceus]